MTRNLLLLLPIVVLLNGCYYMQAAAGQWEVIRKRQPIEAVLADAATPPRLAEQLRLLSEARDFSIEVLLLPDNNSYRTYTELQRDFVVWNVFAAPEFSLQAKNWCFPVAGCVNYRGYFAKEKAVRESRRLSRQGYDVAVGGVAAYSTLGKFSDPVLSTMMQWDDVRLAAVLFHELAHQVVYVKSDTAFNESFATAVEEFGVRRWLESRGQQDQLANYHQQRELQQATLRLVDDARKDLNETFSGPLDDADKRANKQRRLALLREGVTAILRAAGRETAGWFAGDLNNAHLISMVLYEGRLPSFRALLQGCDNKLPCFYASVERLAALNLDDRTAEMERLVTPQ